MAKWNNGKPKWPGVYLICYKVKGVQIYSVGYYRSCGEWVDKSGDPIEKKIEAWCEFDPYRGKGAILP